MAVAELPVVPGTMDTVVLVDPVVGSGAQLGAGMRERGVALQAFTDPLLAIARLGREAADAVVVAARLGAEVSAQVAGIVRDEFSLPVLLAYDGADVDLIGPAILAGAQPLVHLPYDPAELAAAVRQVRPARAVPAVVRAGELVLDPSGYDAQLAGRGIDLTVLEFEVLLELASRQDHVVSRAQLVARWPESSDPDEKLIGIVARLRRKLEGLGRSGAIHTVRGIGYRLESRVFELGRG
ncbi:winged helix-turn-helix domain-containing protein [Isoptericola halotolerans]|uniref:DNA-binding response OmpR family regulator n=1 Tax=Isoptericola halotolerans TaxID=300560 RepID=A0ABX1ZYQ1_9MICO|nr:winged helix-turn-helix domain-containing protein [Isoptericola halotolerans]NOV95674.1 DNA-binding response OmpR family regulator [Isoptericola halotolerans]